MSEILSDALASFEGGKRWLKGTLYPNLNGGETPEQFITLAKQSRAFCAYGAVYKSMIHHGELDHNPFTIGGKVQIARDIALALTGTPSTCAVVSTNDTATSFVQVEKMFCAGIKRALAEEEVDNAKHE